MEIEELYFHHSEGGGKLDEWHNQLHAAVDKDVILIESTAQKKDDLLKVWSRDSLIADLSQLKISANLVKSDGDQHRLDILNRVNPFLPSNLKLS